MKWKWSMAFKWGFSSLLRWAMNRKKSVHFLALEQPKGLKLNNSHLSKCWALSLVKLWTVEMLDMYWIPSSGLVIDNKLNFWVLAFSCPKFQFGIFGGPINHSKWDGVNKYSSTFAEVKTIKEKNYPPLSARWQVVCVVSFTISNNVV